jgi:hypothetical protein
MIFSLSLQGKAKEWFKNLSATSIYDFNQFVNLFLNKWVIKRNIFLILEEYDHLKRQPGEIVQHFSTRFNQVYHSMPADIKPPPGLALLHYSDAFDLEMAFHLRERNTTTLEEIHNNAIGVEVDLLIKNSKLKGKKKGKHREGSYDIFISETRHSGKHSERDDEKYYHER